MSIRKKTILVISTTLLCLVILLYLASQILVRTYVAGEEDKTIRQSMALAQQALANELSGMDRAATDWASWDATYAFIEDGNPNYIQENINPVGTFTNLNLNLLLFIRSSGQIVWAEAFDLQQEQAVALPAGLETYLAKDSLLLRHSTPDSSHTGLILLPEGPLLVAARPIVTSQMAGPIRGTLLMGRFLNPAELQRLSEQTHVALTVYQPQTALPAEVQTALAGLSTDEPLLTRSLDEQRLTGYLRLQDISGQPFVLRGELPREAYQQVITRLRQFVLLLLGVGLVFGVVTLILLEKIILSRLAQLSRGVQSIGASGNVAQRVFVSGDDDLSNLAARINAMLAALEQAQRQQQASEARYRAIVEDQTEFICRWQPEGTLTFVNEAYCRYFDQTRDELVGHCFRPIPVPDDQAYVTAQLASLGPDNPVVTCEYRVLLAGGDIRWQCWIDRAILAENGQILEYQSVGRDITSHKQKEGQIHFQAHLLDTVRQAVIATDLQGHITYWNRFAETMYGWPAADALGRNFLEILPAEALPNQAAAIMAQLAAGEPWSGEFSLKRQDGRTFPAWVSLSPLDDEQGRLIGMVGLSVDMTERKRIEAEIRHRNRELTVLNQVIAAAAAGLEPKATLELACRELALAFGLPYAYAALFDEKKVTAQVVAEYMAEDLIGDRPEMLYHTFPVASTSVLQDLLIRKTPLIIGDTTHSPHLVPYRDLLDQRQTTSLLFLPLTIADEVVGGLALSAVDPHHFSPEEISLAWSVSDQVARALAHARLAQTQQRLSIAVEQAVESVIITDPEGAVVYVNPAFERVSGYSRAEAIGQKLGFLQSGQQDAAFYAALWATINAGQVWHGRLVNKNKAGTLYTEEATIAPVRDESGVLVNYVSVQRDVTRELQLEEQYRQAQKMEAIGRLSGGVAHDFNNLLLIINGYSELLLERHPDEGSPGHKYLSEIKKAGERATGLTRQLLAFSRQQVLQPQILDLNSLVANIEKMLRRLIGEDIDLVTRLDPALGQVKADAGQMEQILLNLAVNARDAMPRGGKLTLETANVELDGQYLAQHFGVEPGAYVMLAVSDSGIGMDAATQARIFEPFFTTKAAGQGTGLGLATVYGIVKQSGGDIRVYSEPGHGTTFKIYLPRVDKPVGVPEPAPRLAEQPRGVETVLLVEDEANVRALARKILETKGYTVLEAGNGLEALRLAEQYRQPIDLLLTDVVMPELSGPEAAEQLALLHPEMKVLYMSGYTDQAIVHHRVLEAELSFLQKPFTSSALVQKVREVLDTRS